MRPTVLLKLTKSWLVLTIIWLIILTLRAIFWSVTLSVDLFGAMLCENVYWALF